MSLTALQSSLLVFAASTVTKATSSS